MVFKIGKLGLLVWLALHLADEKLAQAGSEGPLKARYTESFQGNTSRQCASFESNVNPLHRTSFCRTRYSKLFNLDVTHEFECEVSGYELLGYPGTTAPTLFTVTLNEKVIEVDASMIYHGYGNVLYRGSWACDVRVPLRGEYVFQSPIHGSQNNHGDGFAFEFGPFSR